jgi:hypothetical protein
MVTLDATSVCVPSERSTMELSSLDYACMHIGQKGLEFHFSMASCSLIFRYLNVKHTLNEFLLCNIDCNIYEVVRKEEGGGDCFMNY